eukprot:TRINITY_DN3703_c0_g1_i1.p1 TRINITY_DN3703_c0_g1~~TRINITY_DN3703_c0_g1_i1.p1  ORF type:complete len:463 (+),score=108.68 TRINITY_DN3703_c0_g1_i1:51-1439(+)
MEVIIIGSGISGLSTALHLSKGSEMNATFTILEGRERIGGRINTFRSKTPTSGDVVADMGASFIHGSRGNPITELVQRYNIDVSEDPDPPIDLCYGYDSTGKRIPDEVVDAMSEAIEEEVSSYFKEKASKGEKETSMRHILDSQVRSKTISKVIDTIPECKNADYLEDLFECAVGDIEGYNGAELSKISTNIWDDRNELKGQRHMNGGYDQIIAGLKKEIDALGKTKFHLRHIVNKISFDKTTNRVTVSGFDVAKTDQFSVTGDRVVVTVPLGILQHNDIEFEPALSQEKLSSIQRLGYGTLNKCILAFEKVFWDESVEWINHASKDRNFPSFFNLRFHNKNTAPTLVAFWTRNAKELEHLSDDDTYARALDALEKHFGEVVRQTFLKPNSAVTRWHRDPFTRGSYSYIRVGSSGDDMEVYAAPVKESHLHFAGEGTDRRYFGCTHAAFLSGERVSKEILGA